MTEAVVYQGTGAAIMRQHIPGRSVDMVYMDPPFFTQTHWRDRRGAFSDRWSWDDAAAARATNMDQRRATELAALRTVAGRRSPLLAYLLAIHDLVAAGWSRLRTTGTLWLHCDDHAAAHLRLVCDTVFGPQRFCGVHTWHRSDGQGMTLRSYARTQDTILVYARTGAALGRIAGTGQSIEMDDVRGRDCSGFSADRMASNASERVGYPTQKPLALLQNLLNVGTREGDIVLDPCCGSGTTLVAARNLGRRAIGIDASPDAVALARERLRPPPAPRQLDMFGALA